MSLPLRSGGKANRATAWLGPGLGIAILLAPGQLPATAAAPQDSRNPRPEDAPETRAELPEARERHVITSIQELEQALAGQELGGALRSLGDVLGTERGAMNAAEALEKGIAAEALQHLEAALAIVVIPPSAAGRFAKTAAIASDVRARCVAVRSLGRLAQHTMGSDVLALLRSLSSDRAMPMEVRVAAIQGLGRHQDYHRHPAHARAHADHLRARMEVSEPREVRVAAARQMLGVGRRVDSDFGSEEDVDFLMACIEEDRDTAVRAAAMEALPFRWRGLFGADAQRLKRLEGIGREPTQPPVVRLTAIFCIILDAGGQPDDLLPAFDSLAKIGRDLIASGADMPCWRCRRVLSAQELCRACRWAKPKKPVAEGPPERH